ncbi:HpaII family restriction endonuclease [Exiguobacterium sp. s56]|uniref:HpaII family restriction endonuclease n=1 Tax=Exiguobacterium sp. s56 TaxID=2751232 RepID=UPI001BEC92AF|nr:HpaII family restriction endonuclease [Exiguobacterium sp. s56]
MSTYNKGEWSEFYAFLNTMSTGKLDVADDDLNLIPEAGYEVIKLYKTDAENSGTDIEYDISKIKEGYITVKDSVGEYLVKKEDITDGKTKLLSAIINGSGTFSVPELDELIRGLKLKTIKSPSSSKGDLKIQIYDHRTGLSPQLEFSIKSLMGSQPTLLNASEPTSVYYVPSKVITSEIIENIQKIDGRNKLMERAAYLESNDVHLKFKSMNSTFSRNLQMTDFRMPQILSDLYYCSLFVRGKKIKDVVEFYVRKTGDDIELIEHKIKEMLVSIALGMVPNQRWSGLDSATGGYIIVKENGTVICYHIYDRNRLKNYLYSHTAFDTPSTSRYKAGVFHNISGENLFKLTIQIRFC